MGSQLAVVILSWLTASTKAFMNILTSEDSSGSGPCPSFCFTPAVGCEEAHLKDWSEGTPTMVPYCVYIWVLLKELGRSLQKLFIWVGSLGLLIHPVCELLVLLQLQDKGPTEPPCGNMT